MGKTKKNLFASSGAKGLFQIQAAFIDDFDHQPINEYGSSSLANNCTTRQGSSRAISWSRQSQINFASRAGSDHKPLFYASDKTPKLSNNSCSNESSTLPSIVSQFRFTNYDSFHSMEVYRKSLWRTQFCRKK